jgi:hypothetical protein
MTEAVLRLERYAVDSDLNRSDQITVPARTWQNLYHEHNGGERPLFVDVRSGAEQLQSLVARIRPAAATGELEDQHSCLIPDWMWVHLGAPDYGTWLTLEVTTVADVGTVRLQARSAAALATLDDPVGVLTAALTGSGGASWAVLSVGAELPLWCGVFDVVGLRSLGGAEMVAGCILDHDVTLELVAANATVGRPLTPPPPPLPILLPSAAVPPLGSGGMSFPGMERIHGGSGAASGFVPFGGTGRTIG